MVTLEEMVRFCMYAFHRHGRALLPNHIGGVKRQLSTYFAATDGIVSEELKQMRKELSPTYERLENVAERSVCEVFYDLSKMCGSEG